MGWEFGLDESVVSGLKGLTSDVDTHAALGAQQWGLMLGYIVFFRDKTSSLVQLGFI